MTKKGQKISRSSFVNSINLRPVGKPIKVDEKNIKLGDAYAFQFLYTTEFDEKCEFKPLGTEDLDIEVQRVYICLKIYDLIYRNSPRKRRMVHP